MFEEFFDSHLRIQELRNSPDARLLEGFAQELCQAGYAQITARRHIRAAEHLTYWTGQEGILISNLDERVVREFAGHLDRCQCPSYGSAPKPELLNSARLFLNYLRRARVLGTPVSQQTVQDPVLFTSFCQWDAPATRDQ